MNRQQAKELLPIIEAFAAGKIIQIKGPDNRWYDYDRKNCKLKFDSDPQKYRIKSEPKYRPFANKEECWQEMLKHQPFGWIKDIPNNALYSITGVTDNTCIFTDGFRLLFNDSYKYITFADGTPFGIKE